MNAKLLTITLISTFALSACGDQINIACDKTSAKAAEDLLNKDDPYNGALELTNPQTIKTEPNHVYCRADANVITKQVNYEVLKKSNGDIFIFANPLDNAIDEAFKEFEKEIDKESEKLEKELEKDLNQMFGS